jgi:hypothetical protein
MNLSAEQVEAVREGKPVRILAPEIGTECILIRADVYAQGQAVFDDSPLTKEERLRLLQEFGKRGGWDDPDMDVYEDYRKKP